MAISLYNENKLSSPNEDELDFEELANLSAPIDLANFNSFKDLNISIPLPLVALGTKNKTLIKRFIKVNNIFVIDDLIGNINLTEQDLLELIAQIKANAKSDIDIDRSERLFAKIAKHPSATKDVLKAISYKLWLAYHASFSKTTDIADNKVSRILNKSTSQWLVDLYF